MPLKTSTPYRDNQQTLFIDFYDAVQHKKMYQPNVKKFERNAIV